MAKGIYRTMTEQVADHLRYDIVSGTLAENSFLKEQELSDRFQVSRGTIRHALMQLVREGIVTSTPNIGMKVASRPTDEALQLIITMREEIEAQVLRMVWDNLREHHLADWERLLKAMEIAAARDDLGEFIEADMQFHRYFISLYPDKHILELWEAVRARMMLRYDRLRSLKAGAKEHRAIYAAVKKGNYDEAVANLKINVV